MDKNSVNRTNSSYWDTKGNDGVYPKVKIYFSSYTA